jgi:hypothetical protein
MIAAYLRELADALDYDPALARHVVREASDHLHEAIAAEPADDPQQAERRAIASFGSARELAVQFAAVSLVRRTRRVGVAIVLAIVGVVVMMKARVAWYATAPWTMSDEARRVAKIVLAVDRYAFWLAAIIAIGALIYLARYRTPHRVHAACRKHLRRAAVLFVGAATALLVSVISDLVLTALQVGTEWSIGQAIPIISLAVELASVGAVIFLIVESRRRAARTQALLE